jgi:photosynthetic reaction center H subunit
MREEHRHDHTQYPENDSTLRGNTDPRLRRLSQLDDYEIADGDPDVRSWRVFDTEGNAVGKVHDLIIDMGAMEARYIDLELDESIARGEDDDDRHVLVPIGNARLSDDVDTVTLTSRRASDLATLPRYDHSVITRDRECELLGIERSTAQSGSEFYDQRDFDASQFWGARRRSEGGAYIILIEGR